MEACSGCFLRGVTMAQCTEDVCTECGNHTKVWIVNDVDWLCEECLDDLDYELCDICEEFYKAEYVVFTELSDGRTVCQYCMEDL